MSTSWRKLGPQETRFVISVEVVRENYVLQETR